MALGPLPSLIDTHPLPTKQNIEPLDLCMAMQTLSATGLKLSTDQWEWAAPSRCPEDYFHETGLAKSYKTVFILYFGRQDRS